MLDILDHTPLPVQWNMYAAASSNKDIEPPEANDGHATDFPLRRGWMSNSRSTRNWMARKEVRALSLDRVFKAHSFLW
jgi:hypothetical protein